MLRLDTTTRKLQIVLAGAVAAAQLPVMVAYSDKTATAYAGAVQVSNTNSALAVDICNSPAAGAVRDVDYLSVRNSDTAAATVTIQYDDNSVLYTIVTAVLSVGDHLVYVHGDGWKVLDTTGQIKTTALSGLTAVNVTNTPAGNIAATNVQAALNELDSEKQPLDADLTAIAALAVTGIAARTAASTWVLRTVTGGTGVAITDGDGVLGNPTVALAALADAGSGSFLKITRDGFGRISGSSAVVSADITALVDSIYANITGDVFTGAVGIIAGSAAAPGLYISGDTNTGMYSSAADRVNVTAGGASIAEFRTTGLVLGSLVTADTSKLVIVDETNAGFRYASYGTNIGANLRLQAAGGTEASPSASLLNDRLGGFVCIGHMGSAFTGGGCSQLMFAAENFTSTAQGMFMVWNTTSVGSVASGGGTERMRLTARGALIVGVTPDDANGLLQVSGKIGAVSSSAALPAFYALGDTNTGMYFSAANTVDFSAGGANALNLTATVATFAGTVRSPKPLQQITTGAAAVAGNATLVSGAVTVATTAAKTGSVVMLTRKSSGGTIGTAITYTISNTISFTINSDNILDTSTFSWLIVDTY